MRDNPSIAMQMLKNILAWIGGFTVLCCIVGAIGMLNPVWPDQGGMSEGTSRLEKAKVLYWLVDARAQQQGGKIPAFDERKRPAWADTPQEIADLTLKRLEIEHVLSYGWGCHVPDRMVGRKLDTASSDVLIDCPFHPKGTYVIRANYTARLYRN